jgi:trigger factor
MTASLEEINSTQKRITIKIAADQVDTAFTKAFNNIKQKAKIQGFRQGKAPLAMIKKLYGANVASQVGEDLINANLFDSIKENKLRIVSSPVIEATSLPESGKDYEFAAIVDIMPEIAIKDYKGLSVDVHKYDVTDEAVQKELDLLARRHAKSVPVEDESTAADKGHLATISHEVSLEGEKLPQMDVNQAPVALGKDELYPELETAIIGLKKGETKDVEITLPEDFQDKELAGKKAQFKITLEDLAVLDIPELNDDFAKDINYDSKDKLVETIKSSLDQQATSNRKKELEVKLLGALLEKNTFDVPPAMVDEVIDSMISEMYPGNNEPAKEALKNQDLRASVKDEAKKRAKNTLLLWEVAKAEDIKITDEDVGAHIKKALGKEGDSSSETETQVKEFMKNVGNQIRENLLLERSLDVLIDNATIKELDHAH